MKKSVDMVLGKAPEVYQLFSYASANLSLADVIAHGFNQSLERDQFFGSWADCYIAKDGTYRLKLTSPTHDLTPYIARVKNYLAAGRLALEVFNEKVLSTEGFQFLLPFGLGFANIQSVQLFHFPPNETFFYSDYLYSPTNRRWECLLAQNGFDGRGNSLVERIVDVVPIAAAGGAMKEIAPYNNDFLSYGKKQLQNFLDAKGKVTAPVMAFGGPVRDWLMKAYGPQVKKELARQKLTSLEVLTVIELEVVKGKKTPVFVANHPSMYLYDTNKPVTDKSAVRVKQKRGSGGDEASYPDPLTVMREDLIASGWQAEMSQKWDSDPYKVRAQMEKRWADSAKVKAIMREQNQEFGYGA